MEIVKRDTDQPYPSYRLFNNRVGVVFNFMEWVFSFWLHTKNNQKPWASGGIGFWCIHLTVMRFHLDIRILPDEN